MDKGDIIDPGHCVEEDDIRRENKIGNLKTFFS